MSFDRVHQFVKRHTEHMTFVCVISGNALCISTESENNRKKINRIMIGMYEDTNPVGFYRHDVDEVDLQHDLNYCGVGK